MRYRTIQSLTRHTDFVAVWTTLAPRLQIVALCVAYFLALAALGFVALTHDFDPTAEGHHASTRDGVRSATADHIGRGEIPPWLSSSVKTGRNRTNV